MKIAILSSKQSQMESIRKVLVDSSAARQVHLFNAGLDALHEIVEHEHPDLVILDGISTNAADLSILERLLIAHPNMAVIELCENPDSDFLINSMRVGVRDMLPLPLDPTALLASVLRVEQRLKPGIHAAQTRGKVIAFIACKGGSGATFLATNLGYVLAAKENVKVALLDLNLQFGDAALFVSDQVPANSITDVTENISRVDASFFAANLVQVLPNYGLLAAPENPENAVGVKPEHIDVIMRVARANFDYVILDIGRMLSAVSVRALDQADMIFPVLQETLPFIRDSKRLVHTLLSLGYAKEKIHLLLNRHEKSGDIKLKDVETALDMAVFKTIPNSYDAVSTSVNQGIPIYKIDKHDPVTKALLELSQQLEQKPQTKESGWLSRMFQAA